MERGSMSLGQGSAINVLTVESEGVAWGHRGCESDCLKLCTSHLKVAYARHAASGCPCDSSRRVRGLLRGLRLVGLTIMLVALVFHLQC